MRRTLGINFHRGKCAGTPSDRIAFLFIRSAAACAIAHTCAHAHTSACPFRAAECDHCGKD